MSTRLAIILMLTTFFTSLVVDAAVYRWVDENGKVHYSDRPQPNKNAKRVDLNKNVIDADSNLGQSTSRDQNKGNASTEINPQAAARDRALCSNAKSRLAQVDSGRRMAYKKDDGSHAYLTEEDYARERKQLNALIKKHCK